MSTMFAAVSPAVEGIHCAECLRGAGEPQRGRRVAGLLLGVREIGGCGSLGQGGGGGRRWAQEAAAGAAGGPNYMVLLGSGAGRGRGSGHSWGTAGGCTSGSPHGGRRTLPGVLQLRHPVSGSLCPCDLSLHPSGLSFPACVLRGQDPPLPDPLVLTVSGRRGPGRGGLFWVPPPCLLFPITLS